MEKGVKYIVANWKLNPVDPEEAGRLFRETKKRAGKLPRVKTIVCPPSIFLGVLGRSFKSDGVRVSLGGQNSSREMFGSYTGEVSPEMIKRVGGKYVILGHSEVRASGDGDDVIGDKVKTAFRVGLKVILCLGEESRDKEGQYLKELHEQLTIGLSRIKKSDLNNLLIAYEPRWAIGKKAKRADTPEEFRHNALFIKKTLSQMFGQMKGEVVPVLYGGSVTANNAGGFLGEGQAEGLLVGRESLVPSRFNQILTTAGS